MVPVLQTAKLESKETLIIFVSSSEMANPVTLPLWNSYSDLIAPFDVSITIILPVSFNRVNKIIAKNFLFDIVKLSTQKFSSNVIEKCLDCCDEKTKEIITQKFCDPNKISQLLFDMYGNYVLQKVLFISEEPVRSQLIGIIGPLLPNLSLCKFGQQLYSKLIVSICAFSSSD